MQNRKNMLMVVVSAASIIAIAISAAVVIMFFGDVSDGFSANLGENLANLCSESDLNSTELKIIEHASVKNVQYKKSDDGTTMFYAEMRLITPQMNCKSYSGENPMEYIKKAADSLFDDTSEYISCEITGIIVDNSPIISEDTMQELAACAKEAWNNGAALTGSDDLAQALTDTLCPSPYQSRSYSDGGDYTSDYSDFLDECSEYFSSADSSSISELRAEMEEILTMFFCSVKNVTLSSDEESRALTLCFDSMDIVGVISQEKSSIISSGSSTDVDSASSEIYSALTSSLSDYGSDETYSFSLEIDLFDMADDLISGNSGYFNTLMAITEYYSSSAADAVECIGSAETVSESCVISGSSNATWPVNFIRNEGDGDAIISVIKIDSDGSETSVMKIYLKDGESYMVCLERGTYRLNIAVGDAYYGSDKLFGSDGIYFKSQDTFELDRQIDVNVDKQGEENLSILEYIIEKNNGGSCIDVSEF